MNITPEVVAALGLLRDITRMDMAEIKVVDAFHVLDDAGVFAAIDAGGCTCPADERAKSGTDNHYIECPQAPASQCTCSQEDLRFGGHLYACPAYTAALCETATDNIRSTVNLTWGYQARSDVQEA